MKRGKVRDLRFAGIYIASDEKKLKKMEKKKKRGKARTSNFADIINESFENKKNNFEILIYYII